MIEEPRRRTIVFDSDSDDGDGPTRMLVLYLQGGYRPYTFFVPPMSDAEVASVIPQRPLAVGDVVVSDFDEQAEPSTARHISTPTERRRRGRVRFR